MKKTILAAALASGCLFSVSAQNVIERPTFGDNWQIGLDAGVTAPIKGHGFFKNMRSQNGIHIQKQLTPLVAIGAEGAWGINTTSSKNIFDTHYVGPYGTLNLTNAFCGFSCDPRPVTVDFKLGVGWIHYYNAHANDRNDLGFNTGFGVNFRVCDGFSISAKPALVWNVTNNSKDRVSFTKSGTSFEFMVGLNYDINTGFDCVTCPPDLTSEVEALNARVNEMRGERDATAVALAAANADNAALAAALAECQANPKVVKETNNTLSSVRYVFFKIGSSVITADQQPNVEMIAAYLKNHPKAKVQIRGYASPDGSIEVNERLARQRAESVKNSLIKKYKISADRISAEGEGVGHMFSEESWNRVSICTLED